MSSVFLSEPFSVSDFERVLEAFSPRPSQGRCNGQSQASTASTERVVRPFKPRLDLHENAEKNLVTATFELPGLGKGDIEVEINAHNNRLTVSTETKQPADFDKDGYIIRERQFGKFSRTLQLPQGVKSEEVAASMENGVLTVTFPRSVPELAPKKISVD